MQVVWSQRALGDLVRIRGYIEARNPAAAERVASLIKEAAASLDMFAERGRPGRRPRTRELVVLRTPYYLVYRISDASVIIATIMHGRQEYPRRRS